jgi:hypothetical protein
MISAVVTNGSIGNEFAESTSFSRIVVEEDTIEMEETKTNITVKDAVLELLPSRRRK